MQLTTNMLNNKVDLSKMNAQFASDTYDKTNNQLSDEAKAKLEFKVKNEVKGAAEDKLEVKVTDKVKDEVKDKAKFKLEVLVACVKDLGDALSFAVQCASGSSIPPEDSKLTEEMDSKIDFIDERVKIDEKVRLMKAAIVKENPALAGILAALKTIKEVRKAENEEHDVSINDRIVEDADKSVYTLDFGVDENGIPDNLRSLLGDINADIKDGDTSNMEAYLEKLNGYKDSLLSVQADLEHEDPEVAITKYKDQEDAYQACLAMQPNIFQPTLLDYVS